MGAESLVALLASLDKAAEMVDDRDTALPYEPDRVPDYAFRFGWLRAELNRARRVLREYLAELDTEAGEG